MTSDAKADGDADARADAVRRRRLAEVFGDALPESPFPDSDDEAAERGRDAEIRRDVPPHHGG